MSVNKLVKTNFFYSKKIKIGLYLCKFWPYIHNSVERLMYERFDSV